AVHQFYRDTVLEIIQRSTTATAPWAQTLSAQLHLACFSRYVAAFDLLMRGYYFESIALARGLWEVALNLAAMERGVVGPDSIFGNDDDPALTIRKFQRRSMQIDQQIQRALLWENPQLSTEVRGGIETFLGLSNLATHKSKLQIAVML